MWPAIVVALITGVFGLLNIWFQRRVHRDNRSDHAETSTRIGELSKHVQDVHDDVRDVRTTLHQHANRLFHLEHPKDDQ